MDYAYGYHGVGRMQSGTIDDVYVVDIRGGHTVYILRPCQSPPTNRAAELDDRFI